MRGLFFMVQLTRKSLRDNFYPIFSGWNFSFEIPYHKIGRVNSAATHSGCCSRKACFAPGIVAAKLALPTWETKYGS